MITTAYCDIKKYMEKNPEMGEEEVLTLIGEAEEVIDILTGCKIIFRGYENLSETEKTLVEKAVFSQAEYIRENGSVDSSDETEPVSCTLGSFSYSYGSSSAVQNVSSGGYSSAAMGYLEAAGLLSRRIEVK